jgi:phage shock protein A
MENFAHYKPPEGHAFVGQLFFTRIVLDFLILIAQFISTRKEHAMTQITVEESKLKSVVLNVLNDLFNIGDIEEAKRTPVRRLISPEAKLESLASEVRHLEQALRSEINALRNEMNGLRKEMDGLRKEMDAIRERITDLRTLLYLNLAALIGGLIKLIFFP